MSTTTRKPIEIRSCTASEVPYILQFIRDLAKYEKELVKVEATVETLSQALGFLPPSASSRKYINF